MKKIFNTLILLCVLAACGAAYWLSQPIIEEGQKAVEFTITPGAGINGAAQQIADAGAPVNPVLFALLARGSGKGNRIKAGSYELKPGATPLRLLDQLVRGEFVVQVRALADRRWVVDGVTRTSVTLDGQRITQALLQLSANAARHTRPGDEIGIGSRLHDGRIEFWVRDTGPGVDPALADDIFQRFTRGDDSDEGFGLGLSIVGAIAEAHHGDVVLDRTTADAGTGATFRIRLPLGDHS